MKRDSPAISYLKWTYVRFKDTNSLKDTKNIYQANSNLFACIVLLISYETHFKAKIVI